MSEKDLKINFRYLTGNIACMSVDSVNGEPVHNDIDNEEAIILFNSLVGEKEGCRTLKTLLKENEKLKGVIETYKILIKANNITNWNELKRWLEERLKNNNAVRLCDNNSYQAGVIDTYENTKDKMQELENKPCHTTSE